MTGGLLGVALLAAPPAGATGGHTPGTIVNDTFWHDTAGNPIFSQGGGIFDFQDPDTGELTHYWYGPRYTGARTYYENPTAKNPDTTFEGVGVYSSPDLVNWTYEGDALSRAEVDSFTGVGTGKASWVGRLGVAYVAELDQYALITQHFVSGQPADAPSQLVAVSDSPTGPFRADRRLLMTDYSAEMTTGTGDQTVFTDSDGTSYLVYSKNEGRNRTFISRIGAKDGTVDLFDTVKIFDGAGREGNCLFTYQGRYYLSASDLFGWNASRPYYLVADSITGPYEPVDDMQKIPGAEADFGHVTQTGFYYTLRGTEQETVLYAGDRWADFAGNGTGYNQWSPLSFAPDGTPSFNSLNRWTVNATTGRWGVAEGNDYVRNGAFEADRLPVPYDDKEGVEVPELAGWTRTNPTAVRNEQDAFGRVGNFHLAFSSTGAYSAKVEQVVDPDGFAFPDGTYALTAQVQKPTDLRSAALYATSGGRSYTLDLTDLPTGHGWLEVSLLVDVTGGRATIGVSADGASGQELRADDLRLTAVDLPSWAASATYVSGDSVRYQGSTWTASWWTRGQRPGDPTGPWQEVVSTADGVAVWTPSRTFVAGDVVQHEGLRFTAKWWTRNQRPGDPNGPWIPGS